MDQNGKGPVMNNHQPTLLLVDDDPINLEILIDHLEGAGYQTVSAMDGGRRSRLEQSLTGLTRCY